METQMSRMDLRTQWGKERVERTGKVALMYTHYYVYEYSHIWKGPLEEGMSTHSNILHGESVGQKSLVGDSR